MSLELQVGELKGRLDAVHADVAEIKRDVRKLVAGDNRRRGGLAVLAVIGGFIGGILTRVIA